MRNHLHQFHHQEYEPCLLVPFKNYSFRDFHDCLNEAKHFLNLLRQIARGWDEFLKSENLQKVNFQLQKIKTKITLKKQELLKIQQEFDAEKNHREIEEMKNQKSKLKKRIGRREAKMKKANTKSDYFYIINCCSSNFGIQKY